MFNPRPASGLGFVFIPLITLLCLTPVSASAAPGDLVAQFAQRHNLQERHIRVVQRQAGNRTIKRVFVPIFTNKPEMGQDFVRTFTADKKGMVLHARPADYDDGNHPYNHYVRAAFGSQSVYASAYDDGSKGPKINDRDATSSLQATQGSRFIVMKLGKAATRYAENFLSQFHKSDHYRQDGRDFLAAMASAGYPSGSTAAECMWWLPNLKTSNRRNVMEKAGTKKTKAPQMMPGILIHAAKSEVVEVIGVGVKNKAEMSRMSDDALFGPGPHRGESKDWLLGRR